jgi:polysaccharide biosynthesis transport protein
MSMTSPVQQLTPTQEMSIRDYLDVIRRRKTIFIQVFVMVLAVGIVMTVLSKPVYRTTNKLLVPPINNTVNVSDTDNPIGPLLAATQGDSVLTHLEELQSKVLLEDAKKASKVMERPGIMPPSVRVDMVGGRRNLTQFGMAGNVIEVAVEGGDPDEITRLADSLVALHLERKMLFANQGLNQTLAFVRKAKEKAYRELRFTEARLVDFRKRCPVTQVETAREARARELLDLEAKVRWSEANVSFAQAQLEQMRKRVAEEPKYFPVEETKPNPSIDRLKAELDKLTIERLNLLRQYKESSRQVQIVDDQIASLKETLSKEPEILEIPGRIPNPSFVPLQVKLGELQANVEGYRADHNRAVAEFGAKRGLVDGLGPLEIELTRLTHARDAAQQAFTKYAETLRDLEIRATTSFSALRQIEKARKPGGPIRPKKTLNIMMTAILALCLATGVAFLQEYLDDRINQPEDVERLTALPTLGYVPAMLPDRVQLVSALPANSQAAEAYRTLRSSISFAGIDSPIRRLQITSCSQGEGKSTTAVNLAIAMAMDGKRVILVDADLRRPNVHRLLELPNSSGLSEVLVGMKAIDEALRDTDVENLRVMCAGSIPPNPAELLGSRAFDSVLEQMEERADVVIVDTPPCLPVSDPLIVATRMDGVVLVLHAGQTKKGAIRHVHGMLSRTRARIVGVIFNRIQQGRGGYAYYHYYEAGYYADDSSRDRKRLTGKGRKSALPSGKGTTANSQIDDDEELA